MRIQLVDHISTYRRGELIAGRIAVPFEAALLHEPLGRDGVLPECLLLSAACELALWAAAEASDWSAGAELATVDGFAITQPAAHAELLDLELHADGRFTVRGGYGAAADGRLAFTACALAADPRVVAEDWEVLRGPAA